MLVAVSLLGLGCGAGSPRVSLEPPKQRYRASDYSELLTRWTRDAKIIKLSRLDTPLRVHATFFSPDYVDAYVARYEDLFQISGRERNAMLKRYAEQFKTHFHFVVFAATTDSKWNDLDRRDSIWRVALVNDMRQQVLPVEVKRERRITETTRDLYPFVEPFYQMYTIRFPRKQVDDRPLVSPTTRHLVLRFAGPLGKSELTWRLR